jgi:hypothetical protein
MGQKFPLETSFIILLLERIDGNTGLDSFVCETPQSANRPINVDKRVGGYTIVILYVRIRS